MSTRTSPTALFKLTRSRSGKPFIQRDVKNAGRSEEVYENKGQHDKVPENNSDFVSEITKVARNFAAFARNFAGFVHRGREFLHFLPGFGELLQCRKPPRR
jgi:hypothetical protein